MLPNMSKNLLLPTILLTAIAPCLAQSGGASGDARYLPVMVEVTQNGGKARDFSVVLFKDNEQVAELPPSSHAAFELDLDLNACFTIRVRKEGYREKMIHINTALPEGVREYEPYPCLVDLEPSDRFAHADPFYLDFPSAVVRWNEVKHEFDHSDEYLDEIQLKMALLSAQGAAE